MKKDDMIINMPLECTFLTLLEPCELLQKYQFEKNIQAPNKSSMYDVVVSGGALRSFFSVSHVWQTETPRPHSAAGMASTQSPRQSPTQLVASSMRSPSDEIGRAFNHARDSLQDATRKQTLSNSSEVFQFNSVSAIEDSLSESYVFW